MEDKIPKKNKSKSWELVNLIIALERPKKEDLEPSEYIDHDFHNTPGDSTSGNYVITISRFDSGTSKSGLSSWT